jgi:hypothetical protein
MGVTAPNANKNESIQSTFRCGNRTTARIGRNFKSCRFSYRYAAFLTSVHQKQGKGIRQQDHYSTSVYRLQENCCFFPTNYRAKTDKNRQITPFVCFERAKNMI